MYTMCNVFQTNLSFAKFSHSSSLHIIIYLVKRFLCSISHCRKNLFHSSRFNFVRSFFGKAFARTLAFCKTSNGAPKSLNICLSLQYFLMTILKTPGYWRTLSHTSIHTKCCSTRQILRLCSTSSVHMYAHKIGIPEKLLIWMSP